MNRCIKKKKKHCLFFLLWIPRASCDTFVYYPSLFLIFSAFPTASCRLQLRTFFLVCIWNSSFSFFFFVCSVLLFAFFLPTTFLIRALICSASRTQYKRWNPSILAFNVRCFFFCKEPEVWFGSRVAAHLVCHIQLHVYVYIMTYLCVRVRRTSPGFQQNNFSLRLRFKQCSQVFIFSRFFKCFTCGLPEINNR